jgi:hypothetical protein
VEKPGGIPAAGRRLASLALIGLAVSLWARDEAPPVPHVPANCDRGTLTLFPPTGPTLVVPLPTDLSCAGFSPDGRSIFAIDVTKPKVTPRSLLRIEFNPSRVSAADSSVSMQGSRSPDGKWLADHDHRREIGIAGRAKDQPSGVPAAKSNPA